jgi:hypothetical protein
MIKKAICAFLSCDFEYRKIYFLPVKWCIYLLVWKIGTNLAKRSMAGH